MVEAGPETAGGPPLETFSQNSRHGVAPSPLAASPASATPKKKSFNTINATLSKLRYNIYSSNLFVRPRYKELTASFP